MSSENLSVRFPTRFDRNQAAQSLKMARDLKFWISDNKYTDQLYNQHIADMHLCFCICRRNVFS